MGEPQFTSSPLTGEDKGGGEAGLIPHFDKGGEGGFKDRKREDNVVMPFILKSIKDPARFECLKVYPERQIKAVLHVKAKGEITNQEFQKLLNVAKRTVTNDLEDLVKRQLFEKVGTRGRGTFYKLKKGQ